jgi:type IV secretion system protein VirB4
VRRGGARATNFAGYAALNNVPTGTPKSRWGGPIFYLRTTQDTLYPYHFHVTGDPNIPKEDVASWFTVGGMGSGKTTYSCRKVAGAQRVGARNIILDKDCGLAPFVLANDGEYFVLGDGEDSGVVPLKGLKGTPDDLNHLHQLFLGLIESDGRGGVSSAEDGALASQIEFQMSLPADLRSIDGIWPLLGGSAEGAGARLRKWGRAGRLGWAFDGKADRVNIAAQLLGYDTTALLKNPTVCEPMLTHLFYRFQGIIYQRKPLVISLDECWQTIGNNPGAAVDNKRFVARFDDDSKTIRKNEGAIGLITQNAEALLKSTMASTIQQNMPTKEFFGDRQARWEHLVEGYKLTPREFHIVTQVLPNMRHALLVKRPDSSFIARNDLSGVGNHVTIMSGRRSTYDLLQLLREKHGADSRLWVPHYQRLAPLVVDDPHFDLNDLVEGRTRAVQERLAAE